jgi:AmiR/NasT family two-component response regulator
MADLFKEYKELKDDEDKLMFKAALYASRDQVAVPVLIETAKGDPKAANRSGALAQLEDMLPPKELKPLLEWAAKYDPDPENRDLAERDLKALVH